MENGLNIFVGCSLIGKIVVLELIRRCMDCKINLFFIKRFDLDENVYVFCEYNNEIICYGFIVIIGMIVEGKYDLDLFFEDEEYEDWNEM